MDDITDEGLFALEGAGVTIDDSDTAAIFTIGYKVSPIFSLEGMGGGIDGDFGHLGGDIDSALVSLESCGALDESLDFVDHQCW